MKAILFALCLIGCSSYAERIPNPEPQPLSERDLLAIQEARDTWARFGVEANAEVIRELEGTGVSVTLGTAATWVAPWQLITFTRETIPPELLVEVLVHEFGHALGAHHSDDPRSVMTETGGPCILASEFKHACTNCADICWEAEE